MDEILADLAGGDFADVDDVMRNACKTGSAMVDSAFANTYLQGGKRLRPGLTLALAKAMGCTDQATVVGAAAAVELMHISTLIHDDIIDDCDTRRGRPALHTQIGAKRAIVVGDLVLAAGAAAAAALGAEFARIWADAFLRVCRGQHFEFDMTHDPDIAKATFLDYVGLKTAALISASCELGAISANGTEEQRLAARRYGWDFGLAFQMMDDLLDIVGDPITLGKPTHQDIPNGIYSFAVIDALTVEASVNHTHLRDAIVNEDHERAYSLVAASDSVGNALALTRDHARGAGLSLSGYASERLAQVPSFYVEETAKKLHLAASSGRSSSA